MASQQTLGTSVEVEGVGLHSGRTVRLRMRPAAVGSGIVFVRTDLEGEPGIPARVERALDDALQRQTTVALADRPEARVATIEHLMATFHGLGIDNCRVEIDGPEVPLGDGSARRLAQTVAGAGAVAQDAERPLLTIDGPVVLSEPNLEIVALPSETTRVTFFIDYPGTMIGQQACSVAVDPATFADELAPARTFCLRQEVEYLRAQGLIRGGSLDSALVVDGATLMNEDARLRFDNEFARHKALDLLGDLYLAGRPTRVHAMAWKSGHRAHVAFVKKLIEAAG